MEGKEILELFKKNELTYFTGVPDITFSNLINLFYNSQGITHRQAINQKESIHFAGAYHVSTGNHGVVYMQNSGLGDAINPLTSYSGPYMYRIPMLLLIGWKGGISDEPQHKQMGGITLKILDILRVKYELMPDTLEEVGELLKRAREYMTETNQAFAIIIAKENKIEGKDIPEKDMAAFLQGVKEDSIHRKDLIKEVLETMGPKDILVSGIGNISKEVFALREESKEGHEKDFLNSGGMGGTLPQGIEIALQHPDRNVYVLEGDGASLMQLGSIVSAGNLKPTNLTHIVIDNQSYQSSGNQPSISRTTHFSGVGMVSGFQSAATAFTLEDVKENLIKFKTKQGPHIMIAYCDKKCDKNLGEITAKPVEIKKSFMNNLKDKSL